jgi:hypothetical protein
MPAVLPEWVSLIVQVVVLLSFFPITFVAYRRLRQPKKERQTKWELDQFGLEDDHDLEKARRGVSYSLSEYLVPLAYILLIFLALYSMTNPFVIQWGAWRGLLEDTVNIFGLGASGAGIAGVVLVGRLMFWCWMGAYIYSVDRIIRHYLAKDLTPNVYVAVAKRFTVAFVVGTLIGIAIGVENRHVLGLSLDANLTAVYVVCFFVGMFPENGLRWIRDLARRALGQGGKEPDSEALSVIDGIGVWQEGRLDQEGIINIQNLASANLLALVANTPFDVGQVVDWVDQAILITNTSTDQLAALKKTGVHFGSVLVNVTERGGETLSTAAGLGLDEIKVLRSALYSATNMELILSYRRHLRRMEAHRPESATPPEPLPVYSENLAGLPIPPPAGG